MLFVPCSIYCWSNVCQDSNITRGVLFGKVASFFVLLNKFKKVIYVKNLYNFG